MFPEKPVTPPCLFRIVSAAGRFDGKSLGSRCLRSLGRAMVAAFGLFGLLGSHALGQGVPPTVTEYSFSPNPPVPGAPLRISVRMSGTPPFFYSWRFGNGTTSTNGPTIDLALAPYGDIHLSVVSHYGSTDLRLGTVAIIDPVQLLHSARPTGGGAISISPPPSPSGTYSRGTLVSLRAVPSPGFSFAGWTESLSGSDPNGTVVMNEFKGVIAHFTAPFGTVYLGNVVYSNPHETWPSYRALVLPTAGSTGVSGTAYRAQFYFGSSLSELSPHGAPQALGTGTRAGMLEPTLAILDGVQPGDNAFIQLRSWRISSGATYEEAVLRDGEFGSSPVIQIQTGSRGFPPTPTPFLTNLTSFRMTLPPTLQSQPTDMRTHVGGDAVFQVTGHGAPPPSYQWYHRGVAIQGATESVLWIRPVTASDAGEYHVRASNLRGSVQSSSVELLLYPPPVITSVSSSPNPTRSQPLELSVRAEGAGPLRVAWSRNGEPLPFGERTEFRMDHALPGVYSVSVTGWGGTVTREVVTVPETFFLNILAQNGRVETAPQLSPFPVGSTVELRAVPDPGYEFLDWLGDVASTQNPITLVMDRDIEVTAQFRPVGGTVLFANRAVAAPVFDTDGTTLLSGDRYRAQVYGGPSPASLIPCGTPAPFRTDAGAGYVSAGTVMIPTVLGGELAYVQIRAWDSQAGASFEEALAAKGSVGGSPVFMVMTGNRGQPPTFPAVLEGWVSFHLESGGGAPPLLVQGPMASTVFPGESAQFKVIAEGAAPLTYQWLKDGKAIPNATSASLTWDATTPVAPADAGAYSVRVSNLFGTIETEPVTLSVRELPRFAFEAASGQGGTVRVDPPGTEFTQGTTVSVTAVPEAGFAFDRWEGDLQDPSNNPGSIQIDGPTRVAAVFKALGGTILFGNRVPSLGIDAPVLHEDGTPVSAADGFRGRLYAGVDPDSLEPIGAVVAIGTEADPGYFEAVIRSLISIQPGTPTLAEVRVWEGSAGSDFETALQAGGRLGIGGPVTVVTGNVGDPPSTPAGLVGLQPFAVGRPTPPVITRPPAPTVVRQGTALRLFVEANGFPALRYEWTRDGLEFPGVSGPSWSTATASPAQAGLYRVHVRNAAGDAISEPVAVRILPPIVIESLTAPDRTWAGEVARIRVAVQAPATGEPEPAFGFQWFEGEAGDESHPLTGTTDILDTEPLWESTRVWVRVSDEAGSEDSIAVAVPVERRPQALSVVPPGAITFGDPPVRLRAQSDSGLPVTFEVREGPATISADGVVQATGAGRIVIRVSQPGDARFAPAPPVEEAFEIAPRPVEILWAGLEQTADGRPKPVAVTTVPEGIPVRITYNGSADPPVDPGDYALVATVEAADHAGRSEAVLRLREPSWDVAVLAFIDPDGDGRRKDGDQGLPGVEIRLVGADYDALQTTGPEGVARFGSVPAGTYEVTELKRPENFVPSTLPVRTLIVDWSGSPNTVEFGSQPAATLFGRVFRDLDGGAEPDPGESGLAGAIVWLSQGENRRSLRTQADGTFQFVDVPPGDWMVEVEPIEGYESTSPNPTAVYMAPVGAAVVSMAHRPLRSISGIAFEDSNGNGEPDPHEARIPGVNLFLLEAGNPTRLASAVSGSNGEFEFVNVPGGDYVVEAELPPGRTILLAAALAEGRATLHSPPASSSAGSDTRSVSLVEGGSASVNLASHPIGTITGMVFEDLDGDGRPGTDEPGLSGFIVRASASDDGESFPSAVTGRDGGFSITGLSTGRWQVRCTSESGNLTVGPPVSIVLGDAHAGIVSFGRSSPGTLRGRVFRDDNRDGRANGWEPGVGGVNVHLAQTGQPDRTATTAGDGRFVFPIVTPGSGSLQVIVPDGYLSTSPSRAAVDLMPDRSVAVDFGLASMALESLAGGAGANWLRWLTDSGVPPEFRGATDDPDVDGLFNALEFAMGTSPMVANPDAGPRVTVIRTENLVVAGFLVQRSRATGGEVAYDMDVSPDLIRWEGIQPVVTMVTPGETSDVVRLLDPNPSTPGAPRFLRLRVVLARSTPE
ncbi:MAG: SdrD B-like domain-containing protein [Limisphaerales bacterium]